MATTTEPWGLAPLTTEGLASLGHPLSLSDFNKDAQGRYWRTIRGQKTYYPREWFDEAGTFTGTGTQQGDRAGQDESFFKRGTQWNWTTGQWENRTNWANVIGVAAAGGVGAGIAAPFIAGALGGGAGAGAGGATGAATGGATGAVLPATSTIGFSTLPAVSASGLVPAALATPVAAGTLAAVPAASSTFATAPAAAASTVPAVSAYGPYAGGYAGLGGGAGAATVPASLAATGGGGGASTWAQLANGAAGNGKYGFLNQGISTGLNLYGQAKQRAANEEAVAQELAANKYAADTQYKSNAERLAFERQQAFYDAAVAETNRAGNYDQWRAKATQLGTVGQALGLPERRIPGYVPLPAYPGAPVTPGVPGVPGAVATYFQDPPTSTGQLQMPTATDTRWRTQSVQPFYAGPVGSYLA